MLLAEKQIQMWSINIEHRVDLLLEITARHVESIGRDFYLMLLASIKLCMCWET